MLPTFIAFFVISTLVDLFRLAISNQEARDADKAAASIVHCFCNTVSLYLLLWVGGHLK